MAAMMAVGIMMGIAMMVRQECTGDGLIGGGIGLEIVGGDRGG